MGESPQASRPAVAAPFTSISVVSELDNSEVLPQLPYHRRRADRSATTHTDLLLRADNRGIPTQTIHNASIMTALGSSGLQMYNFGQAISLPFYTQTWTPDSWYDRLEENLKYGMHTLVLLDIKVREQSEENMAR